MLTIKKSNLLRPISHASCHQFMTTLSKLIALKPKIFFYFYKAIIMALTGG